MSSSYDEFMKIALAEAKPSLQEGNHGFGAVIVRDGLVIAQAHDTEASDADPTSHAELNAIRLASRRLGRNLAGCVLVTTHEPCPMCATAIVWSGIRQLAYGYSIRQALAEGRRRIDLTCQELFERAHVAVEVHEGILMAECAVLYRQDVRNEIKQLRGAQPADLERRRQELTAKRARWYQANAPKLGIDTGDALMAGYQLLLAKLGLEPGEAPIVRRTERQIVFRSINFCPTLEACKLLDLDTRAICHAVSEKPTEALLKQLNQNLRFTRNYAALRPYGDYCEEIIAIG